MSKKKSQPTKKSEVSIVRSSAAEYLAFVAATGSGNSSVEMRYEDENIKRVTGSVLTIQQILMKCWIVRTDPIFPAPQHGSDRNQMQNWVKAKVLPWHVATTNAACAIQTRSWRPLPKDLPTRPKTEKPLAKLPK